jgi:flagellar hook-associated protein 3 FlgL
MMVNRLSSHELNITKRLSENEDVDYAEAITNMVTAESIHQAALSVGAKIIQQTLVDFIR